MKRFAVALVACAAILAIPQTASAKRYTAYAGPPAPPPSSAPENATLNHFFPARLQVRAGDTVRYRVSFVHTVTHLAAGVEEPPDAIPDPSGATYNLTDFLGQPFFFNGLPKFVNNEDVFLASGKPTVRANRTYNSGFIIGGNNVTRTLSFPKAGTYTIICQLHPGMKQTVKVSKRRGGKRDKRGVVADRVERQVAKGWASATKAAAKPVPANTVMVGAGNLNTIIGYLPSTLTVKAGTTVNFIEGSKSEIHNMVFGPQDYLQAFFGANSQLPQKKGDPNQVAAPDIYGSEPAVNGTYTYTGTNHGNGFLWTPLMDQQPGEPPAGLPGSEKITFTAPGTYHYFCSVHGPDMAGDIVVTP